jgi:hypothetical protein
MVAQFGRGRRSVLTSRIARTTTATKSTKPLTAAKAMPPKPIVPTGAAELPTPAAVAPPDELTPPPAAVVPHARALRGAQTANTKVSAPAAATFRPVLITSNTVAEYNAEVIAIRFG